jgi:hypothetical protein
MLPTKHFDFNRTCYFVNLHLTCIGTKCESRLFGSLKPAPFEGAIVAAHEGKG